MPVHTWICKLLSAISIAITILNPVIKATYNRLTWPCYTDQRLTVPLNTEFISNPETEIEVSISWLGISYLPENKFKVFKGTVYRWPVLHGRVLGTDFLKKIWVGYFSGYFSRFLKISSSSLYTFLYLNWTAHDQLVDHGPITGADFLRII